jgi:glycosyltransferase involved in cell wall biosynthesis
MMNNAIDLTVVIITLGRETIYKTLETVFRQQVKGKFEVLLILQGKVDEKKMIDMNTYNIPVRILNYPHGLGFGKYRNEGIVNSRGNIVAFIDDDEWTKDEHWLESLTKPIINEKYYLTTAGVDIPITGSYLTNCISLLGYPGGGALGYEKMWHINEQGETDHICSGNFSFSKKIDIFFNDWLKSGAEDADFGNRVIKEGYVIKYVKEATVFHCPRQGFINFIKWHFRRGKSIYEFKKLGLLDKKTYNDRKYAVKNIFMNVLFTKYIFGVIPLFFLQYFASAAGYIYRQF